MSSSGPPPAAPMLEASKCALIMARAVASVIENLLVLTRPASVALFGPRRPHPAASSAPRRAETRRREHAPGVTLRRRARDARSLRTRRSVAARSGRPQPPGNATAPRTDAGPASAFDEERASSEVGSLSKMDDHEQHDVRASGACPRYCN